MLLLFNPLKVVKHLLHLNNSSKNEHFTITSNMESNCRCDLLKVNMAQFDF